MRKIILLLCSALVVSCVEDKDLKDRQASQSKLKEITMSAQVPASQTRSAVESVPSLNLPKVDTPVFFARALDAENVDWTSKLLEIPATLKGANSPSNKGDINFGSFTQYYNEDEALNSYFVGYFPKGKIKNDTISWDINGKKDILLSEQVSGNNKTNHKLAVQLPHKLTWLEFNVIAKDEDECFDSFGHLLSIEVLNTPLEAKCVLPTKFIFSDQLGEVSTYGRDDQAAPAMMVTETSKFFSQVLLAPADFDGDKNYLIRVTTSLHNEGIEVPVSIKENANAEAGCKYIITLTFKKDAVQDQKIIVSASSEVTPWKESIGSGVVNG